MVRVVSTAALPAKMAELLGVGTEYIAPSEGDMPRPRLLEYVAQADGLITLLTETIDVDLLRRATKLRVIANYAVGYDNIDVDAATGLGIVVCNTPDVLTPTTADMTFALLLGCARRLLEGDQMVRSGSWTGWRPDQHLGFSVSNRTLGIVGMGRIGHAVAQRARAFNMRLLYTGWEKEEAEEVGAQHVSKEELLKRSDFVSLHCPLTEHTRHYIDADALAQMQPHAILLNTSRGGCIDEAALVQALRNREIGAAGLDVYENEPDLADGLAGLNNVILAPHAGSATQVTRRKMAELCAQGVRAVLSGQVPANAINPTAMAARG